MNRTVVSLLTSFFCLLVLITLAGNSVFATGTSNSNSAGASTSFGPATWNLRDPQEPLLKLPDNFPPSLDLSFTFPFDRFGIPLLHSLKYNASSRRYLLMLVSEDGKRGDFFQLQQVGSSRVYSTDGEMHIELLDQGSVKVLRDFDGNQYNFIATPEGELRCAQIRGTNGTFIRLGYNRDGLIETFEDNSERSIKIDYADAQLASLTQTWKAATVKKVRRWNAANGSQPIQPLDAQPFEVRYSGAPTFGVAKSVLERIDSDVHPNDERM